MKYMPRHTPTDWDAAVIAASQIEASVEKPAMLHVVAVRPPTGLQGDIAEGKGPETTPSSSPKHLEAQWPQRHCTATLTGPGRLWPMNLVRRDSNEDTARTGWNTNPALEVISVCYALRQSQPIKMHWAASHAQIRAPFHMVRSP